MSKVNERIHKINAAKIPAVIRDKILDEGIIDKANTNYVHGSHMEFLFDVYMEFINNDEFDDFSCPRCRTSVHDAFLHMKPHLIELKKSSNV
jgi:hypothetical protein